MEPETTHAERQRQSLEWFRPLSTDLPLSRSDFGGKASQLAELIKLGANVPPGIALHRGFFDRLASQSGLTEALQDLKAEPSLERVTARARELIMETKLDVEAFEPLLEALSSVDGPWIVRSSAIGEDGAQSSFAGQLESIGGICSAEQLVDAIKSCWASRWSTRVLSYERALKRELAGVAVVVQKEIQSKVAGVVFTRSPVSLDSMMIEYCDGPGERLVNGEVNPVRISVDRRGHGFKVEDRGEISACLSSDEERVLIDALERESLSLEARREIALDLEWVLNGDGQLYFVQMRPITTLKSAMNEQTHGKKVVWSNANMNENYPEPVTPLLASIATKAYHHYFEGLGRAFGVKEDRIAMMQGPLKHLVGVHGGRLYYNLTNIYAILQAAPFHHYLIPYWNQFIGVEEASAESSSSPRADTVDVKLKPHAFTETLAMVNATLRWIAGLESGISRFETRVDGFTQGCSREVLSQASLTDLAITYRRFMHIRFEAWTDAALADAASTIAFGALRAVLNGLEDAGEPSTLARELLEGGPPVESGKPIEALWDLSRRIRENDTWHRLFSEEAPEDVLQRLQEPEHHELLCLFEDCVDRWGFRVSGELLLTKPSLDEDPIQAIVLLRSFVGLGDEHSPESVQAARQERAAQKLAALKVKQGSWLSRAMSWRWQLLERVIPSLHAAIGYRERARLKQSLLYNRFRRLVLEMGKRLTAKGYLAASDDVFYLSFSELDDLASGHTLYPETLAQTILSRRDAHAMAFQFETPNTISLHDGEHYRPDSSRRNNGARAGEAAAQGTTLTGTGACSGVAEGTARVLGSMAEAARFQKGDILVAKQTDPGWGPLFVLAGGLVLERGGLLSHGAIVAREFGIPAVVGAEGAFTGIAEGSLLKVDGDAGTIVVIETRDE